MPAPLLRIVSVALVFLTGCSTTGDLRPVVESKTRLPPPSAPQTSSSKPSVVTVPVDTGLEERLDYGIPAATVQPQTTPLEPSPLLGREEAAAVAQGALDTPYTPSAVPDVATIDPAMNPVLPVIDTTTPSPIESIPEVRPLPPRIGDKLFLASAPPAVHALENDIESKFKARAYGDAASQLDRAIRIQPKNPELWHVLAEIRLRQNQPEQAEDLAKKSISLSKGNSDLIRSNWRLISDARRQKGDGSGSQEALEKAWATP
jgi:Tetratricopeptide repeat